MNKSTLYPLRFPPLYQYRVWGGRRLSGVLSAPLPGDDPIGEAWILSDREDHASRVADGPLRGRTIQDLMEQAPEALMGRLAGRFRKFPLLLKFLDAAQKLSVQVHPSDRQSEYLPPGESGKTEAWVVLEAGPESRIYAGLKPGATPEAMRASLADETIADRLARFTPRPGDAVLIPAGTVHSLERVVVFEVQQNSDVTFRLYDWARVDPKTGEPRPLQVDRAMACIDFDQGEIGPVRPVVEAETPALRERLFDCHAFTLWRIGGASPFTAGASDVPRVLVGMGGQADLEFEGGEYGFGRGDVVLLPAAVGVLECRPRGEVAVLEIALPG